MKSIVCMMPLLLLSGCGCPIKMIKKVLNRDSELRHEFNRSSDETDDSTDVIIFEIRNAAISKNHKI